MAFIYKVTEIHKAKDISMELFEYGSLAHYVFEQKMTKKFGKLLDGVVFTISGLQNPLRGEIRGKGLEMGAKYKGDWDKDCTHLICAFANTPKFNQVSFGYLFSFCSEVEFFSLVRFEGRER